MTIIIRDQLDRLKWEIRTDIPDGYVHVSYVREYPPFVEFSEPPPAPTPAAEDEPARSEADEGRWRLRANRARRGP